MIDDSQPEVEDVEVWDEEEIDEKEVESVVAQLEAMMENVESETILEFLEAACEGIADLVEWDEEEDDLTSEAA